MEHILFIEATTTGAGLAGIKYARSENMHVSFFTRNKNQYINNQPKEQCILEHVGEVFDINTNDEREVINAARLLNNKKRITAITTFADFYVPVAAAAAEALGLKTIPYNAASLARNKFLMRQRLLEVDADLNPAFTLASTFDDCLNFAFTNGYPFVLKPQNDNDGYNVMLINNEASLKTEFEKLSSISSNRIGQRPQNNGVLLEDYINAQEYSVETVYLDDSNSHELIGITRKYVSGVSRGRFIEIGHCFPVEDHIKIIEKGVKRALNALGIINAVCHTEVKVVNNSIKIIEINPRLAGGGIGSDLIPLALGLDPIKLAIDLVRRPLGRSDIDKLYSKGAAIYKYESNINGYIRRTPQIPIDSTIVKVDFNISTGQKVIVPERNGDLLGTVYAVSETASQAFTLAKAVVEDNPFVIEYIE